MIHRGENAVEDVIQPVILTGALHGDDVLGVGHHTDGTAVPAETGTQGARAVTFRQILTDRTACNGLLCLQNGLGEGLGLLFGEVQHVKSQPLGGFGADAGQTVEVLYQGLQGGGKVLHDKLLNRNEIEYRSVGARLGTPVVFALTRGVASRTPTADATSSVIDR